MILPDANLLIYAIDDGAARHDDAKGWLEEVLSGRETVGFAWTVLIAVIRLTTNRLVFDTPLSMTEATTRVEEWLGRPMCVTVEPTQRHVAVLRGLLAPLGTAGNLVPDAHLAALAIEHGASVASADHDFGRFTGLRWFDPLAKPV